MTSWSCDAATGVGAGSARKTSCKCKLRNRALANQVRHSNKLRAHENSKETRRVLGRVKPFWLCLRQIDNWETVTGTTKVHYRRFFSPEALAKWVKTFLHPGLHPGNSRPNSEYASGSSKVNRINGITTMNGSKQQQRLKQQ